MFSPKYHELCGEIKAPAEKIEEVIAMTENNSMPKKRRNPLKMAGIIAAALALTVVSVSAAAPEAIGDALNYVQMKIISVTQIDDYRSEMTLEGGMVITSFKVPEASVENRDGRAILTLDGEDAADITEDLEADSTSIYETDVGDTHITVTVEGSIDHWTAYVDIREADEDAASVTVVFSSEDPELDPGEIPGWSQFESDENTDLGGIHIRKDYTDEGTSQA